MILKYIPNLLTKEGRKQFLVSWRPDGSFSEYLVEAGFDSKDVHVIVGGKPIKDLTQNPKQTDEIVVAPDLKEPITAALIALGVSATLASYITAALYIGAVVGFAILSAAQRPRTPSFGTAGTSEGLDASSPTYGWEGIQTTQNVGTPIPIVYGQHRVGGNVINQFVDTDGDKNYLNCLLALCEGEVESITSAQIDKNAIANYSGITEYTRVGANSQSVIPNFEDLHDLISIGVGLNALNSTHSYTTVDTDVEGFDVHLNFPSGLYSIDATSGSIGSNPVTVKVEYRVVAGGWTTLFNEDVSGANRSAVRKVIQKRGLTAAQYEIKVTRMSAASGSFTVGDMTWQYLDAIKTDDLSYPNTALYGVRALATDQLSGGTPNFTLLVKGKKVSIPDIRVSMGGSAVAWDDYYYKPSDTTWRRFSDDLTLYWDGTTYVDAFSANPVWCIRDLLVGAIYGLGEFIATANIDTALFLEMAKYCDEKVADGASGYEKRFRLDVVIDSPTKSLDAIVQLLATFRGMVFFSEGSVKLRIDKPESDVQIFGMGNIVKDSFNEQWKSIKESPNMIEAQFLDEDKNYEQDTAAYIDETALTAGAVLRKKEIRLFCTRISQVIREARYALNVSKYVNRTIQFKVGTDGVAIQAGDVFGVAHDVPQWGFSGRVVSAASTTVVTLDQEVTLAPATTYKLRIRRGSTDVIEEKTVSTSPSTTATLTVSSAFSFTPSAYDVYSFGISGVVVKSFRAVSIERQNDVETQIAAIEYNASIYDDTAPVIPTTNYSQLDTDVADVLNLDLTEGVITAKDGTVINTIDVWFGKPDDTGRDVGYHWQSGKIYLSDDAQDSWRLVGQTTGTYFQITGVDAGKTYYVRVVSVANNGLENSLSDSPLDSLATVGKTAYPDNISGFAYTFAQSCLRLAWNDVTNADLAGYEVRTANCCWGCASPAPTYIGYANDVTLEVASRSPGTYYAKAFNSSCNYSPTAACVVPTNSAPSAITGLGADIFFNFARLYWDNSSDADVLKYQIYKSESNAWAGEETLYGETAGRELQLQAKDPRSGCVSAGASTTCFCVSSLIGLGDDYFNNDKIYFTSGVNIGLSRTICDFVSATGAVVVSSALTGTPAACDCLHIKDVAYYKVRAIDFFGVGTLSSAYCIEYTAITADMMGDASVTARNIYVAQLSAISADMGCLTAGCITGGVIQTGSGGQRLRFTSSGIYGYNASCCERLRISTDGNITATDVTLVDPACACNYSYLSAGSWYFHDTLGTTTPYPKRICSGTAAAGATLIFCGWCCVPQIMLGVQQLTTYDPAYCASCQKFCIYSDTPVWFCSSASCFGYCTVVHASLYKGAGVYSETVHDSNFAISAYTHSDACGSKVKVNLQLWATSCVSTDNYCYGSLAYKIKYKVCSCAAWCECSYTYNQPHACLTELQTTQTVCHDLLFTPEASACMELQVTCTSLTWCVSALPQAALTTCCRTFIADGICAKTIGTSCLCCLASGSIALSGTNPATVCCNIFCICGYEACVFTSFPHSLCRNLGACLYTTGTVFCEYTACVPTTCFPICTWTPWISSVNINCVMPTACNACNYTGICVAALSCLESSSGQCVLMCSKHLGGFLIQCYYPTVSAVSCEVKKFYSNTDCTGALTVIDSGGVLNYLAVSFG